MKKEFQINDKKVDVYPDHHMVLTSWARFRQRLDSPPFLVSLDHHTDTRPAFLAATFDVNKTRSNEIEMQRMISEIDFTEIGSVAKAVENLRHDEHIDAGIKSRIISKAFVISYDSSSDSPSSYEETEYRKQVQKTMFSRHLRPEPPKRPFTYPEAEIYLVENLCAIGCQRYPHDDDCTIPHYNQALESILLEEKMSIIREMSPGLFTGLDFNTPYILDIDLDYFHTCKSVMPSDNAAFYKLIKGAGLITIATEESFINEWRDEHAFDKDLHVDFLLERLLDHIKVATEV